MTVLDASVAVTFLLGDGTEEERALMRGELDAPSLLDVEVTQTLRNLVRGGKLDLDRAELARADLSDLRVRRHPDAPLLRRAWALRDVCTTYDALYVALAEALDTTLLTRDSRLARGLGGSRAVLCDVRDTAP